MINEYMPVRNLQVVVKEKLLKIKISTQSHGHRGGGEFHTIVG